MKTSDFNYDLPDELIARYPSESRSESRLLVVSEGKPVEHKQFSDIESYLKPGDLLVVNNTEVIPARLYGQKSSGGKLEILIERIESDDTALAHIRSSRSPKPGAELTLCKDINSSEKTDYVVEMLEREGALFRLKFPQAVLSVLDDIGHMPLPPYIDRDDEFLDKERYQTVYAQTPGAVAAPTAGLHFDDALIERLKQKGIEFAEVTLHVGAGTFQPVKVDNVEEHQMHSEWIEVTQEAVNKIKAAKEKGGRILAVGTTAVRSLETASQSGEIKPFTGDTDIFIYPGKPFHCVDMMITNFHLPESTLLMLVSAFAGVDEIKQAYQTAIEESYRFFSYGDAMLLFKKLS